MKRQTILWITILAVSLAAFAPGPESPAADWVEIAPGISYREFRLVGPNRAFVARMDRGSPNVTLETGVAPFNGEDFRETVSDMASRYEGALSAWGPSWGARSDVIVAINGAFHDPETGVPDGVEILSGWYSRWTTGGFGGAGFIWTLDRTAGVNLCAHNPPDRQRLTFLASGATLPISGVDARLVDDGIVLFTTDSWNGSPGSTRAVEVVVKLPRPAMLIPLPRMTVGVIEQVRRGQPGVQVPFDHVVITGTGTAAEVLLENARPGGHIGISLELVDLGPSCEEPRPVDWSRAYAGVAGGWVFLQDGEISVPEGVEGVQDHPRTAIAYNDDYIFFVVVDGRQPGWSLGMTIGQLAVFCRDRLEATWGVNQDGGGSSIMWVNGVVKNRPSDGFERRVPNGLMMVAVQPMQRSTALSARQRLGLPQDTPLRLGPGTNFRAWQTIPGGESDTIIYGGQALNGVYATGSYWWFVDIEGLKGWIQEEMMVSGETLTRPPAVAMPLFP